MPFEHLAAVAAEVDALARRFDEAGHRLYLVGGIVRDLWLDQPHEASADIDLTTDAPPATTKQLVGDLADALWTQGERFGTIGLRHRNHAIEITTHRAESYTSDSRKPEVSFGDDIAVDLSRRDFTVNAMAVRVPHAELVDPWGGAADLAAGVLRTPLDAATSFTDDPLRMLRAARFSAKYELAPTNELIEAASELRDRLRIVAIERIGDELRRLFALERVDDGLRFLATTGLAEVLLTWNADRPLEPHVAARLFDTAGLVARVATGWQGRLAAYLLGLTDNPSAVAAVVAPWRLSRDDERTVVRTATGAHAALQALDGDLDRPVLRRWGAEVDDAGAALAVAAAFDERIASFTRAWTDLCSHEDPRSPALLDGATIMQLLQVEPGPVVGDAVALLNEAYIENGPLSADEQTAMVRTWWRARNGDG